MALTDFLNSQTLTIQIYNPSGGGNFKSYASEVTTGTGTISGFVAKIGLGQGEGSLSATEVFAPYVLNGQNIKHEVIDSPPRAYNMLYIFPIDSSGNQAAAASPLPLLNFRLVDKEIEVVLPADWTPSNQLAGFQIEVPVWSSLATVSSVDLFWSLGETGSGLKTVFSFYNSNQAATQETSASGYASVDWGSTN